MPGVDKIWEPLAGKPVVVHSLHALSPLSASVVLVVRAQQIDRARHELSHYVPGLRIVAGGAERQESVANGIASLEEVECIAIHDAARPLVPSSLIQAGINCLDAFHGAVPVLPLYDTIKRVTPRGTIGETLDRSALRAVQTPQVFRACTIRAAHRLASNEGRSGTDDAALVEALGHAVTTFPGAPENFKITTDFDLRLARLLLGEKP